MTSNRGVIVLANGVFDIFHIGHLRHLQAARAMGEVLIVSVTEDGWVNKGPGRPKFCLADRMAIVQGFAIVDEVIPARSLLDAMKKVQPTIVVKGSEYSGRLRSEDRRYIKANAIEVRFTNTMLASSTEIIDSGLLGGK